MARARRVPKYPGAQRLQELANQITARLLVLEADPKANEITMTVGQEEYPKFITPLAFLHPSRPAIVLGYWGYEWGGYVVDEAVAREYLGKLEAGFKGRHRDKPVSKQRAK